MIALHRISPMYTIVCKKINLFLILWIFENCVRKNYIQIYGPGPSQMARPLPYSSCRKKNCPVILCPVHITISLFCSQYHLLGFRVRWLCVLSLGCSLSSICFPTLTCATETVTWVALLWVVAL